jgi:hypothetical protein
MRIGDGSGNSTGHHLEDGERLILPKQLVARSAGGLVGSTGLSSAARRERREVGGAIVRDRLA